MFSQVLPIVLATLFVGQAYGQGNECNCSSWMDRDNPSGVGDYEVTDSQTNPTKPCPTNYYVQARVSGTSTLYNSPDEIKTDLGQVVYFVVNANQQYGVGMYCKNADNTETCKDYEARFCCAGDDTGTGCSVWMDRDYPSGVGDFEITDAYTNPTKPSKYAVQARRYGYTTRYNSPQEVLAALGQNVTYVVNSYLSLGVGMYCRNDQNGNNCMDYQARFCPACTT